MEYIAQLVGALQTLERSGQIERVLEVLRAARDRGNKVLIFGNGGSAATAEHFACDLNKGATPVNKPLVNRFRALALTSNVALLTAYANDISYDEIFVRQVETWGDVGDVAIAISGSGRSRNVLNAILRATGMGLITIGLCGYPDSELTRRVDIPIITGGTMEQAEDMHLIIEHIICTTLRGDGA